MTLYYLTLLYWLVFFFINKKTQKPSNVFFAVLPLFLLMALKSVSVGSDTISYYARYVNADYMLDADNTITEPGYNLISYFFHDIVGLPFWVYNAILSGFICFVLALFLYHFSLDIHLSLILYMTIGLFSMSLSGLRQMLAISMCTIPLIMGKKSKGEKKAIKRFLIGIVCVGVAFLIHNSAIVFLPILFLMDIRLTRFQAIIIMMIAISSLIIREIIVGIMSNFVFARYEQYDLTEGYAMNSLVLLIPIFIGLFCVFVARPNNGEQTYSKDLSLQFLLLSLYVTFNNLALSHAQIARLGYYFMNAVIILIPYALKKMSPDVRKITTFAIIILSIAFFYLGTNGGTLRIDDYKFFWQEPMYLKN